MNTEKLSLDISTVKSFFTKVFTVSELVSNLLQNTLGWGKLEHQVEVFVSSDTDQLHHYFTENSETKLK